MQTSWRTEVPPLFLVIGMFVAAVVLWPIAPERIPVHWNIQGEIDRYGGRFEGLLALPLIAAGVYSLFLVLPKFDPCRRNYLSFANAYFVIRLAILSMMVLIYACILLTAFGHHINMGEIVSMAVGMMFIIVGNVMGKIRPNWFVGVRTPWTLSSRRSWNKTHRLAGWLFVAMGFVTIAYGFAQTLWMAVVAAIVVVGSLSWTVIYSYLVWRTDPERLAAASISPSNDASDI